MLGTELEYDFGSGVRVERFEHALVLFGIEGLEYIGYLGGTVFGQKLLYFFGLPLVQAVRYFFGEFGSRHDFLRPVGIEGYCIEEGVKVK